MVVWQHLQESLIHVGLQAPDPKSPDSAAYSHPTGFWKLHTVTQNLKPPTVIQQASESYELFKGCPAFDIKIQKRSLGPNMVKQGFLLKENALKFIPPTLGKNLFTGLQIMFSLWI